MGRVTPIESSIKTRWIVLCKNRKLPYLLVMRRTELTPFAPTLANPWFAQFIRRLPNNVLEIVTKVLVKLKHGKSETQLYES